jgi:hypothetical protein
MAASAALPANLMRVPRTAAMPAALLTALLAALAVTAVSRADEPADAGESPPNTAAAALALTPSQQQAVGIRIERPLPLNGAVPIEAYGTLLDPVALVTDLGRLESTRAAAAAAGADATRLERLYHADQQASLKAWQASQAQSIEAGAQARAAAMSFGLQWGPLSTWSAERQRSLLEALTRGREALLRAEVPGHHIGGVVGEQALLEVDGVHVVARVLGPLPRTDAQAQSNGWLLELVNPPPALGPGARVRVRLRSSAAAGVLVPASALLYAESGAYVYRQQRAREGDRFRYEAVAVKPLARVGDAWLVDGLGRGDQVVVQGAGVLWSLQGISSFSAAEEEHD